AGQAIAHFFLSRSISLFKPLRQRIFIPADIMTFMSKDFVFTMKGLSKTYPPGKKVLNDIYLSFYYGAKIGVIGLNGAGKSTLLKIMAGVETEFEGEAFPGKGITVGFLPQEPKLDDKLTVKENVAQG